MNGPTGLKTGSWLKAVGFVTLYRVCCHVIVMPLLPGIWVHASAFYSSKAVVFFD